MRLQKFGPVALLLTLTASLAILAVPGTLGAIIIVAGISVQQSPATVTVTIHDCAGNPVPSAVIQLQSLGWGQWAYANSNGVAILSAPPGTYTLQGGYGNSPFSQTIYVGAGGYTETVSLGKGCATTFSSSTQPPSAAQATTTHTESVTITKPNR